VLKIITANQFWSLVKSRALNENDYPISQNILTQVKNSNGVLDLFKLSKYIENNGWDFE
jgi:hypothetical protein|tara:strand:- start:212 stop:388 length:177 start_codon:yes stop_codon:yes gene_type:complete